RERRKVLAVVNEGSKDARIWKAALDAGGVFQCDVKSLVESEALGANELGAYRLIGLFGAVRPSQAFWERLAKFVQGGGGLALVPGGAEMRSVLNSYNAEADARGLLPAPLEAEVPRNPKGVP